MGVNGLTSLLQQGSCRAQAITRAAPTTLSSSERRDVLLIDASCVKHRILEQIDAASCDVEAGTAWHADVYTKTVAFYRGLQLNSDLELVLVTDGGIPQGPTLGPVSEKKRTMPPTFDMIVQLAYHDLGLHVER